MPERRISRAERRRYSERTGRRPARERPARNFEEVDGTVDSVQPADGGVLPVGTATATAQPARMKELAPSSARSVAYIQHRQQEIVKDLRGLVMVWGIIIVFFVATVVYLTFR